MDAAGRWGLLVLLFVGIVGDSFVPTGSQGPQVLFILAIVGWVAANVMNSRSLRVVPRITAMTDADPERAESLLVEAMRRWPLQRNTRLSLYHRLAVIRHRQQRFEEATAICEAMLNIRLGSVERARVDLWVILLEASMQRGDLSRAYGAISALHALPLGLIDRLRLLALQTRYEIAAGHDTSALAALPMKTAMAALLPAPLAGAIHTLLATAARRTNQSNLADWLERRAQLLATPEQTASLLTTSIGPMPVLADDAS